MRLILLILILVVVALIAAVGTGLIDIRQTRPAQAPDVETGNGISASGGQTPAFDIETGSVSVGATEQNVTLPMPTVNIDPANSGGESNNQAPATTNSQ